MAGRVVLASASERRRDLLARAGLEYEVLPADVSEQLGEFDDPVLAATVLAQRKAEASARMLAGEAWVIGADTIVAHRTGTLEHSDAGPWSLLGKPESEAEAAEMLSGLSATRHLVVTGVCVVRASTGEAWVDHERTWVRMRAITAREVAAYVASGEWRGKAGGYAIQETADRFVEALEEGGFDNVVGLPVQRTLALLGTAGWTGTLASGDGGVTGRSDPSPAP